MVSRETNELFKNELKRLMSEGGIPAASEEQLDRAADYYDALIEENKLYNLTSITDPVKAAADHFYDSIIPVNYIKRASKLIDVGSGAGFPVAPIVIIRPDIEACALDSTEKKCRFIEKASQAADIKIETVCMRAEEAALLPEYREKFDVCVSRAVAKLNVLAELCAAFIKPGGLFLAYKSGGDEIKEAENAAETLNLKQIERIKSPVENSLKQVLVYQKQSKTPKSYPRRFSQIKKKPL